MTNCIVPTFADAPELETVIVETPYPFGPAARRASARSRWTVRPAAVANAVADALGRPFDSLPILPEVIARGMHS